MQLNLFQGTGAPAMPVDTSTEAADKRVFTEHPCAHKNLAKYLSRHLEGEALLLKLGNALEAFSDASSRQTSAPQQDTPRQLVTANH
ncbi:hypothetical protein AEP_02601 [Curvibacter sp. AEP1-3]|nr:hypothetical protein AEP_02601 [Curvibacter sp. AEP1-3]